jgi:5-methylcytosine-specific restriction endonuclease McrA
VAEPVTDLAESLRHFEPDHCANCLKPLPLETEGLFCTERCRQLAEIVRRWRRITRDGRINRTDVLEAHQIQVAHLLAGGYAKDARHVSKATKDAIRARDNGLCQKCGEPADPGGEIDHIEGDSSDLGNLQLLCLTCHHAKTWERMRPATDEQRQMVAQLERERVLPDQPVLLCDDEVRWRDEWRRLREERRGRLEEYMADVGYDRSSYPDLSWKEFVELAEDDGADDGPEDG